MKSKRLAALAASLALAATGLLSVAGAQVAVADETPAPVALTGEGLLGVVPALKTVNMANGVAPWRPTAETRVVLDEMSRVDYEAEARVFARDLGELDVFTEAPPVVKVTIDQVKKTDIVLTAGQVDAPGFDRYRVEAGANRAVWITAPEADGLWNGTRTVLQSLKSAGAVQAATVIDWADYEVRSLHVDAARKYFSPDWFKAQIKRLSLYKLNEIQLHFSENEGFRLEIKGYPEVLSTQFISQAELAEIIAVAAEYHVDVVPAMDVPGHMHQVLKAHPEWAIGTDEVGKKVLDYSKPVVRKFVTDVITELAPLFPSKKWHMGGDEVFDPDRLNQLTTKYPQLAQYARDNVNASASVMDGYMHYLGTVDAALNAAGFETVRVWNDALYTGTHGTLPSDVQVTYWTKWHRTMPSTAKLIEKGHKLINYNDGFFYYVLPKCPTCAYNQRVPASAIYENWVPTLFSGRQTVDKEHVLGSSYAIWADKPDLETEQVVANGIRLPLAAMAERVYSPGVSKATYEVWEHRVDVIDGLKTGFPPEPPADRAIPVDDITVTATSEETNREDGRAVNVLDGRTDTLWHSAWSTGHTNLPHSLTFDLKRSYPISGLRYTSRQDLADDPSNSMVRNYRIYVSNDGQTWGDPVASGSFPRGAITKEVDFTKVEARYVKFEAVTAQVGSRFASAAEIRILQDVAAEPTPTPTTPQPKVATPVTSIEKNDAPGTGNDTYTIPTTEGVVYKVLGVAQSAGVKKVPSGIASVVVTAEAAQGYVLAEGATTRYELSFSTTVPPKQANPPATLVTDDKPGTGNDTVTIPEVEGIYFTVNGLAVPTGIYKVPAGVAAVRVIAMAKTGYFMAPGSTASWDLVFSVEEPTPTPTPPVDPTPTPTPPAPTTPAPTTPAPTTPAPQPPVMEPGVGRLAGADRVDTALAAFELRPQGTDTVVLTTGRVYADAVAAGPLAKALKAPVVLTVTPDLEAKVLTALTDAKIKKVTILGGTSSVSIGAERTLRSAGMKVERVAGGDRYDTAARAADKTARLGAAPKHIFVADGRNFPDALAAGVAAANSEGVLVLSNGTQLPARSLAVIDHFPSAKVVAAGGAAIKALAEEGFVGGVTMTAVSGTSRYETAAKLASYSQGAEVGFLASGEVFADALAGGAAAANYGGPLLLTEPGKLPAVTGQAIQDSKVKRVNVLGGPRSVDASVVAAVQALLK
ncbi:family 20 glycosylhydrolase [Buchananella felis]|uniref:family 20 glycosylhydrolase n=1 Tax=Buchananella felis TaxID=3231492 RepID=UPI0035299F6B